MLEKLRSTTSWGVTLMIAVVTGLVAALTRLPGLAGSPPGFSAAEARAALSARGMSAGDLLYRQSGPLDSQQPLFSALLWLTGSLAGWGVTGPRLAAALLGIVAAVGCALWYRRALGPLYGMAGGLLVATTFPWLVLSRQAQPAIGAAACAALGLWCLWEGLGPRERVDRSANRGWWIVAAGIVVGLGLSSHPSFLPALVVVPASVAFLSWRGTGRSWCDPGTRWLIAGLACLLLTATPLIIDGLTHPDDLRQRIEQDWNGDGRAETIAGPLDAVSGYGETVLALAWNGHDVPALGTPDRGLLDPLLLLWTIAGLVVIIARPLEPLHGIAILWLLGFGAVPALLDPGNPALLMPLMPVLFLLPLLALRAGWLLVGHHRPFATRLAIALAAISIAASAGWSIVRYAEWTRSDATYLAFDADLREALAAVDDLAPGAMPVYVATDSPSKAPLLAYFGPSESSVGQSSSGRVQREIDGRSTLVVPADGAGYLVTTATTPVPPELLRLLSDQPPVATGETPNGTVAWQIRTVGQPVRERLPWTLPVLTFPDGFELAGFDIRPDLGDVATTGQLPDPPRVLVTLVWSVPRGATPHIARVRLLPTDPAGGSPEQRATAASTILTASPPIAAGNRGRELVIVQVSVPVPASPDLIVEVQAGLSRGDGSSLPPIDAGANEAGDYVLLNRVQYVPGGNTSP